MTDNLYMCKMLRQQSHEICKLELPRFHLNIIKNCDGKICIIVDESTNGSCGFSAFYFILFI